MGAAVPWKFSLVLWVVVRAELDPVRKGRN